MKKREPGNPRWISRPFWALSWPFWKVGNILSHLGTRLSFGKRPEPEQGRFCWEVTTAFWADSEERAGEVFERIQEAACGCADHGWCELVSTGSMKREPEFDNEE